MAVRQGEIEAARRIVEAYERTASGACVVDGKLVDYAMYQRAKKVLELAKLDR